MAKNYKEASVTGTKWQRVVRVVVENPYNGKPFINFVEEEIVNIGEGQINRLCGNIIEQFDPEKRFPLINPQTGDALGQDMDYATIYVALHSLYMYLSAQRDQVAAETPAEGGVPAP